MIKIIIFALIAIIIVAELSTFIVYGSFVSKQITRVYMNLDKTKIKLNPYNTSILSNEHHYISTVPFSIFSKYRISEQGIVLRWSKLHKKINEYYEIAFNQI